MPEVIETTATSVDAPAAPPVAGAGQASRAEVQSAARLLGAVVGGLDSAVGNNNVRSAFAESFQTWHAGWDAFIAGIEKPVWNIDTTTVQLERQIDMVDKWRAGLKGEVGGPVALLFDAMPLAVPTVTRARAAEIVAVADELNAPMQRLDNLGARGAWDAWSLALRRFRERIDASWWTALNGETVRTLEVFAEQVEEWRKRLVRYEREAATAAKEPTPAQQAVGSPPRAGWPTWAKVAGVVGIVGGAYVGVRWVISHWASGTPVRPELPMSSPKQEERAP